MKAFVYSNYGPPQVLRLEEREKPVPKDDELLIKVHATTVTSADWRARSLEVPPGFKLASRLFFGIIKPRQPILGTELAGEVESVGKAVKTFTKGDRVFAFTGAAMGCHVEYKCMPAHGAVVRIPEGLSYEEAAALSFGGTTALDFLRKAGIQEGDQVLINGASGCVGTAAVQIARHYGAEVTGVCSSDNLELVSSLDANHVIDYTREDFTRNGRTYDIIMDTAGTAPYSRCKASLTADGRLLLVLGGLSDILLAPWISITSSRRIIAGAAAERPEDLGILARLAEAGEYKPVIDRRYSFNKMVEAHRYVDKGHKRGNVVITLGA